MNHTVYVIYSDSTGFYYRGYCKDMELRMDEHNDGRFQVTNPGVPWVLLWSTEKNKEGRAKKLTRVLRNFTRKRLLEFMIRYPEGLVSDESTKMVKDLQKRQEKA